jgi:(1->4)-alpha-D-glucan 1-alpha-D-glucosylmutase
LNSHFLGELGLLARRVAYYGQFNSLAQVLLKLTSPGVPDIYQGQELWDFSLVDPDNRRPVDYERRQGVLNDLQERVKRAGDGKLLDVTEDLLEHARDGRIKLYTTAVALAFRQRHEALFAEGNYTPLATQGVKAGHVCAFARQRGEEQVLVVVPRLVVGLTNGIERPPLGDDVWGDAWLALPAEAAGAQYRNVYTNEILVVSERDAEPGLPLALILGHFPVALLERKTPNGTH